jgi:glycosyltransferase involved in cell wall biosynthesis
MFYDEITKTADGMRENRPGLGFEFLFIDDGSEDGTPELLREFAKNDVRCRYISFSRNFGKEAAMFAGLEACKGGYAVIIDADLQHPPSFIPRMYE